MRRLLAAVAVLTLTACINDSIGVVGTRVTGADPGSTGIAGNYTLQSVGGAPLPFSRSTTIADKAEILDAVITLTNTNSWSEVRHERRTTGGVATNVTLTSSGTFSLAAGDMEFTSPTASPFDGKLAGNTLTLYILNPAGQLLPALFTK
jgi:hypothetical protein